MAQQLPLQLYRWLIAHQAIELIKPTFRPNGKFELEAAVANEFSNGVRIAKLALAIAYEKNITVNAELLASLKNSSTPASRLYNWNVLSEVLETVGYTLTKAQQKEILAGSFNLIVEFLLKLMKKTSPPIQPQQPAPKDPEEVKPKMPAGEKELNIDKIDPKKPPTEATSLLQIIILVSAQSLELPPKQILALLGDGCNYFAHLLVKGVKGAFEPLLNCLERFREVSHVFVDLLKADASRNFEFSLQLLKPGLLSKSESVAIKTAELLVDLFELIKSDDRQWLFKELCRESTLFDTIYLCLKRHPHLTDEVAKLIFCLSEGNICDFFVIYFKKSADTETEYLKTVLLLFNSLVTDQVHNEQIKQSGVILSWVKMAEALSNAPNQTNDTKILAIELLCCLYLQFVDLVEELSERFEALLEILKKHSRSESTILKVCAINRLFDMLEHTARNRSRYASLLYKKMIFLYLENHHESQIRELVLLSFNRIFQQFPSVPVDLIVQPFVKQLQLAEGSTYLLNLFDISFIRQVSVHPKLSVKSACILTEFLMKLYLRNLVFSKTFMKCASSLTQRFIQHEEFRDMLAREVKDYLTAYNGLVQKGNRKKQQDAYLLAGQKRSLIVEMIKIIIQLEESDLNDKLKIMIGQSYSNLLDSKKHNDKGLFALLSIFGIPEALVEQIRSQQHNQFKEVEAVEGVLPTQKLSPEKKHEVMKRNHTSPKPLVHKPPLPVVNTQPTDQSFSQKALLQRHNLGYRQSKLTPAARLVNRSADSLKPDEKVINDIQKVKLKFIQQQSKMELVKLEEQRRQQWKREATKGQILQKNISLGFSRVGDITGKMLYEFGTVREAALPSQLHLIRLDEEEDRDKTSIELTLKKQAKIMKVLFSIFSNASQATRRLAGTVQEDEVPTISFTETVRMLKDWNMGKLPSKVIVGEIMKQLNSSSRKDRNVLMGLTEDQFPELLTQFTAVLDIYDPDTRLTTIPLGLKLDRLFSDIVEGEIQKFDDDETATNNYQKTGEVPNGYKKITDKIMEMKSTLRIELPQPFKLCVQIVDGLLRTIFGTGPIEQWGDITERVHIRKIQQKAKSRPVESAVQIRRNKTQSKIPAAKEEQPSTSREDQLKQQRRLERLRLAKIQLQQQRANKMAEDAAAKRKEKEQQLERERKKELQRKKEIEEKKQLIKQHKLKLDEEKQLREKEKKQHEEAESLKKKEEREKFFRKQKERLKEDFQERGMKAKQGAVSEQKRKQQDSTKKGELAKKMNSIIAEDKKIKEKENEQNQLIKESLAEGEIREMLEKSSTELKGIFKHYSQLADFKIERTEKMVDVKGYSTFVRDYGVSPQLLKLQNCLALYRYVLRNNNAKEGLTYDQFLEILIRLAIKSSKSLNKSSAQNEQSPGDNEFDKEHQVEGQNQEDAFLSPQLIERFLGHIKPFARRYK